MKERKKHGEKDDRERKSSRMTETNRDGNRERKRHRKTEGDT